MEIPASYSTVSEDELLSSLVPLYEIDAPQECRFWTRGINDTYQVRSAESIYSLRVYRHGLRSRSEIDFEIDVLIYLHEQGAQVANPIARRDGEYVTEIQAPEGPRCVIVTAFAKGDEPNYDKLESGRLFGASVAQLHTLSEDFQSHHARPGLDIENLLDVPMNTICPFLAHRCDDLKFIEATAAKLRDAVQRVNQSAMDFGLCHGDCHGCNVHLHNGSLMHFDFDCCGIGYRVFELATFKWGIHGDDNAKDLWSSFLEGYQSGRDVSAEDLSLVDTFVVIRHIWWMALIMGNARDFGHRATSDRFIDHQIKRIGELMKCALSS